MTVKRKTLASHLMVSVFQDAKCRGYRILNLAEEYHPLMKELSFRALAASPRRGGERWRLNVRVVRSPRFQVVLEAHAEEGRSDTPLCVLEVPGSHFTWLANDTAWKLKLEGSFSFALSVLSAGSEAVARWRERLRDFESDVELCEEETPLHIPESGLEGTFPHRTRLIAEGDAWVRCVFSASAFGEFLEAARSERSRERAWVGCGRPYVTSSACSVYVEEIVGPLPAAESGPGYLYTRGRDVAGYYESLGERRVAYAHLHPRTVEGRRVFPRTSGSDHDLAWDYDRAAAHPCVFPIALFGTDPSSPGSDVAAYGYDRGVLTRVRLEVVK